MKRIPSLTRKELSLVEDYAEANGLDDVALVKGFDEYLWSNRIVFARNTHSSDALATMGLTVATASDFQRLMDAYLAQG